MKSEALYRYVECVNKIEDFFEYRYKHYTKDEIKSEVMKYVDELVKGLQESK